MWDRPVLINSVVIQARCAMASAAFLVRHVPMDCAVQQDTVDVVQPAAVHRKHVALATAVHLEDPGALQQADAAQVLKHVLVMLAASMIRYAGKAAAALVRFVRTMCA